MRKYNLLLRGQLAIFLPCFVMFAACGAKDKSVKHSDTTSKIQKKDQKELQPEFSKATVMGSQAGQNLLDYGRLKKGVDTAFVFKIRCDSKAPLKIYKLEADCVCTTSENVTPITVKMDRLASIKVRYNTNLIGTFAQRVLVFNNSAVNPIILNIKGEVYN